jgi:hypothetical protein
MNFYPYFPRLLFDSDQIWYKRFARNAIETSVSFARMYARNAVLFVWVCMALHLRMYRETARHFESTERHLEFSVLRHWAHHFSSLLFKFTVAVRVLFNVDNWYKIKFHGCIKHINSSSLQRHCPRNKSFRRIFPITDIPITICLNDCN